MKTHIYRLIAGLLLVFCQLPCHAAPEAFEVGPGNKKNLPKGKEADGIIGDFILRNDKVEAVISGDLPLRRANMSTFYGANGITPGCLYDLTLRGANNDQITVFTPSRQEGAVSFVRVKEDGAKGVASIVTVITAANNNGLFKRHEYRLRDGWQGVLVITTLHNESAEAKSLPVGDRWTTFSVTGRVRDIIWADAVDPADRAGYAFSFVDHEDIKKPATRIQLQPGDTVKYARFLAVGQSPAEAIGKVSEWLGETGTLEATVTDQEGKPMLAPRVDIAMGGDKPVFAYPDKDGRFSLSLPPDSYDLLIRDIGRASVRKTVSIKAGQATTLKESLKEASAIRFEITDGNGRDIPCKAQFIGIEGTRSPVLGPQNRAHGCRDQYHSETGAFRVQVPPGRYRVVVTHGPEFSHLRQEIDLKPESTVTVRGALERLVDTRGWVSADFHNHSTPSGDNTCGTDDRVISLAVENIEFAPTTEHNRLYDWKPHIEKLGLADEVSTIPGIELTGSGAHLNAFPFTPDPYAQDGGAPVWDKDPRISAIKLGDHQGMNPERWLQINHPDLVANFIDRNGDGRADGGYIGLSRLIDGLETINGNPTVEVLADSPYRIVRDGSGKETIRYRREFIWLQLLNRGHRLWCVAVSDAHSVHGNGVGGWRMYLPSSTDDPGKIDWREMVQQAKAGRIVVSSGPFLEVATSDGTIAGGTTRGLGKVQLKVKVQCTDWIDIDRVQVLVNGRARSDLNFTRASHPDWFKDGVVKFDRTLDVALSEDSHVIVVAAGEKSDLSVGFGSSTQGRWRPCAYNNPIFVDVDGGGFAFNGDTLGWDLPVKGISVEQVKRGQAK